MSIRIEAQKHCFLSFIEAGFIDDKWELFQCERRYEKKWVAMGDDLSRELRQQYKVERQKTKMDVKRKRNF